MENVNRSVEVADLDAVANVGEDLVLFIYSEDDNVSSSLCVQANFDRRQFDPVQPMGVYLESNSYLPILDVDARISNRQRILDEINPEVITAMLSDFTNKKWPNLGFVSNKHLGWEPGG